MNNILENIFQLLIALIGGGVLGFFFEKQRRRAEVKSIEADVMEKVQEVYNKFLEDYKNEYEKLTLRIQELEKENKKLRQEIQSLQK